MNLLNGSKKQWRNSMKKTIKYLIDNWLDLVFAISIFFMLELSVWICIMGWNPKLHIISIILGLPSIGILAYYGWMMCKEIHDNLRNQK